MKRTLRILFSIIAFTVLAAGLWIIVRYQERQGFKQASSFDDLEISVEAEKGIVRTIVPSPDADGNYCFYLPSYAYGRELRFDNLTDYARLYINDERVQGRMALPEDYTDGRELAAELRFGKDRTENCSLRFKYSQGIDAVFIDTASGSVKALDSGRKKSESGSIKVISEDGIARCSIDIKKMSLLDDPDLYGGVPKSYKFNFTKKAYPVPGADNSDEWVLIAEPGRKLESSTEFLFRTVGTYAEKTVPKGNRTDVYADGRYLGRYRLCEKTESVFKNLDLNDLNAEYRTINNNFSGKKVRYALNSAKTARGAKADNPKDISGGYMLERVSEGELTNESSFLVTDSGIFYEIIYPKNASLEMAEYLRQYFNEVETAIFAEDGVNPVTGKGVSDYLDTESWALKYVAEQYFSTQDAHVECTYLYKYPDKTDSHIFFGPFRNIETDAVKPDITGTVYADELLKKPDIQDIITEQYGDIFSDNASNTRSSEQ